MLAILGRLCRLTGDVGCARDVFLGSSLEAFAHKMGELGTEDCCTQTIYVQSKILRCWIAVSGRLLQ